jgi:hypothetical protein
MLEANGKYSRLDHPLPPARPPQENGRHQEASLASYPESVLEAVQFAFALRRHDAEVAEHAAEGGER